MTMTPELEALHAEDHIPVANRNAKRNYRLVVTALVGSGAIAIYLALSSAHDKAVDNLQNDEEFRTTSFRPPSFLRQATSQPPPKPAVIALPAPQPAPVPVTSSAAPAPVEAHNDLPFVEEFPERYRSKLLSMDQRGVGDHVQEMSGEANGSTVAGDDKASRYLNTASHLSDRSARARQIARIDAVVPEGTMIPGILETAVNSDLPGQIRAITAEDVYSFDGRRLLIPTGTRLIGEYQSDITRGQRRIFVVWTRLIRNDGVTVRLNSIGADGLGRSGLTGHVDNKFKERFGSAILLSIVGAGASYLTGYGSDEASGDSDDAKRAEELARDTIARTFSSMANTVLSENLRIQPTINIAQGERIFVYVRQDLDFSDFYPDPVSEAMKEIRRERQTR
ncbi:type IV secretion system protein VirB10 [Neorhizobium sp. NCHU2750]|uniref:type IV secretion system protein VirB10 n=1 Tax=Neorhizobium sp. NCHU2750 TaxID=1825976 RepID=UPI000E70D2D7|nr:type IV secretion protein AvhB10 [Neorhizobium sp. NCHU2750]